MHGYQPSLCRKAATRSGETACTVVLKNAILANLRWVFTQVVGLPSEKASNPIAICPDRGFALYVGGMGAKEKNFYNQIFHKVRL